MLETMEAFGRSSMILINFSLAQTRFLPLSHESTKGRDFGHMAFHLVQYI